MRKKFMPIMAVLFIIAANNTHAQWNLNGNNNATNTSILGTTNAIPLNLTTRNLTRLVIDSNGKVGIGIAAPPNVFSVKGSGAVPNSVWVNSGNPLFTGFGEQTVGNADYILSMASTLASARPVFIGRRAKGTLAAPLSVSNNDHIMSFLSSAYDGTAFQNAAAIDFFVDGTPAAGSVPARISFVTGSNSSNRAERFKIGNTGDITINSNQLFVQKSTGNVGIGTTAPNAQLQLGNTVSNRKIALFDIANSDHQFYGFGINNATLRYQVDATSASHVFYAGTSSTSSNELMRIQGNGNVGIGSSSPAAKLEVAGSVKIADGTQGTAKVLTSDANGLASWQKSDLSKLAATATPGFSCVGTVVGAASVAVDIPALAISGNYAYMLDNYETDMKVFDISNPAAPFLKNTTEIITGLSPRAIAVSGNYAYVVDDQENNLAVFDISNPAFPVRKNTAGTPTGATPSSIAISGNYAYVASKYSADLRIYDISNPSAPVWKNTAGTPAGTYPYSVAVSGNYAYLLDYISNNLRVYDISNPAALSGKIQQAHPLGHILIA